ncbi:MAG: phosphoenolpyruvate--protein phosphotransferase [Polyangia bacterium]
MKRRLVRMRGTAASTGIAIATARVIDRERLRVPKIRLEPHEVAFEKRRLAAAVEESQRQLSSARQVIEDAGGGRGDHSLILDAQLLMLDDEMLIQAASELIERQRINAEWALRRKMDEAVEELAGLGDAYLKERSQDINFVGRRVLRNLLGHTTEIIGDPSSRSPCAVIAASLSPAETAQMVSGEVAGFATEEGTRTSHTAIMSQALGIPAVVGVERLVEHISPGDDVIIDGIEGLVIIRPDRELVEEYRDRKRLHGERERRLRTTRDRPSRTRDGVEIELWGNIELPAEAPLALDLGVRGIGLYRTEFVYLNSIGLPDEEKQLAVYREVVRTMSPHPVVFRTFDLGADKLPGSLESSERNPALGLRAIRVGLKYRSTFRAHLRALLRASAEGDVRIMFPMISGLDELRQVRSVLDEVIDELGPEELGDVPIGCMIELPAAVMAAESLAHEVDFFSIGTNDLIQYSLAIDRNNDHVSYLYSPYHPSILRMIDLVAKAAADAGIDVSVCGGMASEPLVAPLLLGLGIRTLSMAPSAILHVKNAIRSIDCGDARQLAREVLELGSTIEVEERVRDFAERHFEPIENIDTLDQ